MYVYIYIYSIMSIEMSKYIMRVFKYIGAYFLKLVNIYFIFCFVLWILRRENVIKIIEGRHSEEGGGVIREFEEEEGIIVIGVNSEGGGGSSNEGDNKNRE